MAKRIAFVSTILTVLLFFLTANSWSQAVNVWGSQIIDAEANVGRYTSLAFDPQGNPAISYYDVTNENLKYAHWNGASWDIETVDSEGKVGYPTSLAFHSSGNPSIAYYDYTNNSLNYAYWNGSVWNIQEVDDVGSTYNDFLSYNISLVLDPVGNPAIAYNDADPSTLKYACFDGMDWDITVLCHINA